MEDLRYLEWKTTRDSSGTAGAFLKATEIVDGKKYYYKMSNYDNQRLAYGQECINEIVAQNLAKFLGIEYLEYKLVDGLVRVNDNEFKTLVTKSRDFKAKNERKLSFETFYEMRCF
jgi:hypothetical protein